MPLFPRLLWLSDVDVLQRKLEHEQEKREEMEREMDHLRQCLHLANKDIAKLQIELDKANRVCVFYHIS